MRRRKILAIFSMVVVFLVWASPDFAGKVFAIIFLSFLPIITIYGIYIDYQIERHAHTTIQHKNNILTQIDREGNATVSIDVTEDYELKIPYFGYPEAIYRVRQGNQTLEFSSKTKDSEHLVVDVLKFKGKLPLERKWNYPWQITA